MAGRSSSVASSIQNSAAMVPYKRKRAARAALFVQPPSVSFAQALRDIFPRQWLCRAGEESLDQGLRVRLAPQESRDFELLFRAVVGEEILSPRLRSGRFGGLRPLHRRGTGPGTVDRQRFGTHV